MQKRDGLRLHSTRHKIIFIDNFDIILLQYNRLRYAYHNTLLKPSNHDIINQISASKI